MHNKRPNIILLQHYIISLIMLWVNEYLLLVIIVQMELFCKASAIDITNAYIYRETLTWHEASRKCQMIGPIREINVTLSSTVTAWIGASAEYTTWAEYKGCYVFNNQSIMDIKQMSSNNPFLWCSDACKSNKYFGIRNSICACMKDDEINRTFLSTLCNIIPCKEDVNTPCPVEENGFAIFKKEQSRIFRGVGNCMSVRDMFFSPGNCSQQHRSICQKAFNREEIGAFPEPIKTWIDGLGTCLPEIPASLKIIEKNPLPDGEFWTAATRRYKEIFPPVLDPTYCIAANVTKDGDLSRFVKDCNDRLPVLCKTHQLETVMDNSGPLLSNQVVVIMVLSVVLGAVLFIVLVLIIRLRRKGRDYKNQSIIMSTRPEIEYAQVDKPITNSRKKLSHNQLTSYDVYDQTDHTCRPRDLKENTYDTMESVRRENQNEDDVYNATNQAEEQNNFYNEDYSHIEINDIT